MRKGCTVPRKHLPHDENIMCNLLGFSRFPTSELAVVGFRQKRSSPWGCTGCESVCILSTTVFWLWLVASSSSSDELLSFSYPKRIKELQKVTNSAYRMMWTCYRQMMQLRKLFPWNQPGNLLEWDFFSIMLYSNRVKKPKSVSVCMHQCLPSRKSWTDEGNQDSQDRNCKNHV
jgi:hypothetical protein